MLKLVILTLFFSSTAFSGVELHPAVKEDFYKGNWAYIYPNYSDKPEQARASDVAINDTLFTTNVSKFCKACPTTWPKDYRFNEPYIYAFTKLYETPDFKGSSYTFAITLDHQVVFITPQGEENIMPLVEKIGDFILNLPVIHKKEFSAIWYPKEKRFLFAKNPSYHFIASPQEGSTSSKNINDTKKPHLHYELNPQSSFYSADQKVKLKFEDFKDSLVKVKKVEEEGIKIGIRDLSCGRGRSNVIAGICSKPAYLLEYHDCGKVTEAFIKNEDLILASGEMALLPRIIAQDNYFQSEFVYVDREDNLAFPKEIKDKIKNHTINESDIPTMYRLTGEGGATQDINIEMYSYPSESTYNEKFQWFFNSCDPETGKLQ